MRRVRVPSSLPSRATSSAALRARCAPRRASSTVPLDLVIPKPAPAGGPRIIQPGAPSAQRAPAVTEEEFAHAMEPLRVASGQTLAIAVSGGPDSMALTLLLNRWAAASRVKLVGITIDHRFREESAAEAKLVREWFGKLGIEHQTCDIQWDRNMTPGQRLNLARVERYRRLIEKAREFNAHTLCVGHHKDDQIETFLMRLSLMSGLDGLGCMTSRTRMNRFPLVRPLLTFSKDQLRATCSVFNQAYVEDPSNDYEYQLRARSRVFVDKLAEQGFNTNELLPLIEHIGHLRDSAAEKVEEFLLNKFIVDTQFGFGCTRRSFLRQLPRAVLQRVLVRLVMYFGGRVYPPSLYAINVLMERIMSDDADFPAFTAGNCYVFQDVGHAPSLYFAPEGVGRKYKGVPVASGETVVIDNVWSVSYKHERGEPGCVVYLDPKNWSTFVRRVPRLMELQRLPPRCRLLPIVLSADRTALLAIPYENIFRERGVSATAVFQSPVTLFRDRDVGDPEEPVEAR